MSRAALPRFPAPGAAAGSAVQARGLRANALAVLLMLVLQDALGNWVGIAARVPAADRGRGIAVAFLRAVAAGPAGLAAHALLGALLIAGALAFLLRALAGRRAPLVALAAAGLASISVAALGGARFVATGQPGATLAMALAAAVAQLVYVVTLLFAMPGRREPDTH